MLQTVVYHTPFLLHLSFERLLEKYKLCNIDNNFFLCKKMKD